MKKLLIFLAVALLAVAVIILICAKVNKETTSTNTPEPVSGETAQEASGENEVKIEESNEANDEATPSGEEKKDEIVINQISNIGMAKLAVESKTLAKEDLPSDIRYLADVIPVDNAKLNAISAYYTKSDYTQELYNVLHDYICFYFDEDNEKNVKISVSKEGNPLRDYFFQAEKEPSLVKDVKVVISQYEDKFIANFATGRYQFDVETNKLNEEELVKVIEMVIDNTEIF